MGHNGICSLVVREGPRGGGTNAETQGADKQEDRAQRSKQREEHRLSSNEGMSLCGWNFLNQSKCGPTCGGRITRTAQAVERCLGSMLRATGSLCMGEFR